MKLIILLILMVLPSTSYCEPSIIKEIRNSIAHPISCIRISKYYNDSEWNGGISRTITKNSKKIKSIEDIFTLYGIPKALAMISVIESGVDENAISKSHAVGAWQFKKETAIDMGLTINDSVDERRLFKNSSMAAARYLRYLRSNSNNWTASIASYNGGPNYIKEAMELQKENDYWKMSLTDEVGEYVPKVFAAILINEGINLNCKM